jgi:hypothetical protein
MEKARCGRKTLRTFGETLPFLHVLCDLHPLSSLQKVNLATKRIRLCLRSRSVEQALIKLEDLHLKPSRIMQETTITEATEGTQHANNKTVKPIKKA